MTLAISNILDGIVSHAMTLGIFEQVSSAHVRYDEDMPRGIYPRSESQLEGMRARWRAQGAKTKPSAEAREKMSQDRMVHGHSKRSGDTTTYRIWRNMLSRCQNANVPAYSNYGGRGISVCSEWETFENFLADMGERPEGLTLDRIDNDGNYEPGNCRWASTSEQGRNKRGNRMLTWQDKTQCLTDWSEETGIAVSVLWARVTTLNWTVERALTTPVRRWPK